MILLDRRPSHQEDRRISSDIEAGGASLVVEEEHPFANQGALSAVLTMLAWTLK